MVSMVTGLFYINLNKFMYKFCYLYPENTFWSLYLFIYYEKILRTKKFKFKILHKLVLLNTFHFFFSLGLLCIIFYLHLYFMCPENSEINKVVNM